MIRALRLSAVLAAVFGLLACTPAKVATKAVTIPTKVVVKTTKAVF
ncbi:MAG: hypothetical protein AAGD04_06660 [Pseudomonadota bacterium]